jgi:putative selenate reductase
LVRRFRDTFGDRFPISFAGGIDAGNFADAASTGLVPITVCSDLLKPGGYARARKYLDAVVDRMAAVGAKDLDTFIIRAHGHGVAALTDAATDGDPETRAWQALAGGGDLRQAAGEDLFARWVSAARLRNTASVVEALAGDPRYHQDENRKLPKKIGSHLVLFDCITRDKCIPVCPNDANFTFVIPPGKIAIEKLVRTGDQWEAQADGEIAVEKRHQIGNFADFCNDCGNCDVFCPEDGGPYLIKPRFFGTRELWESQPTLDGFFIGWGPDSASEVSARFDGVEFNLTESADGSCFSGAGFRIVEREGSREVDAGDEITEIDLTHRTLMRAVRDGVHSAELNYVNTLRS